MKDWLRGISEDKFEKVISECISKIEGIIDKDWQDIVDEFELGIHRDVLRKAFQSPFGGYAVYQYLRNNTKDPDLLSELEEKIISIKEERVRLNDTRRKLNLKIRENARYKNNLEILEYCIMELEKFKPMNVNLNYINFKASNNEAVLVLSDLHIGINIENYFNCYNTNIAKERLIKLALETLNKCELHKINKIHVLINGDLISGAIHKSLISDADISLIESVTKGSEIISEVIKILSDNINNIEVYFAIGNHSRINPNKKENLEKDNFEYLMFDFIKLRLKDVGNINFNTNSYHSEIISFNIFNKLIIATHGDKDKPTNVAKNMTQFIGVKPYKIYLGHYHSYQSFDCNGTHVTVNGSVVSTDSYAFSLRLNSEPYQVLTIFSSETGKEECEYRINLR